jgi:SAM-dependent methyltransferase
MNDVSVAPADRSAEYAEYYESRVPTGFGRKVLGLWHRRMHDVVSALLGGFGKRLVLEVGAGWGFFGNACRLRGVAYRGLEMNATQAERLRKDGLQVDAGAIPPFPAGVSADVIWLSHVLEHASGYPQAIEMMRACLQTLTPGGHVVVIGPDLLSWRESFWDVDWSHGFPTTAQRVEQLLRDVGFVEVVRRHHTATFTQPAVAWVLAALFSLVPYRLFDAVLERLTGRTFCQSFMAVFGWRQILVIGRKAPAALQI